jgi:hypothetical protein
LSSKGRVLFTSSQSVRFEEDGLVTSSLQILRFFQTESKKYGHMAYYQASYLSNNLEYSKGVRCRLPLKWNIVLISLLVVLSKMEMRFLDLENQFLPPYFNSRMSYKFIKILRLSINLFSLKILIFMLRFFLLSNFIFL